MYLRGFIPASLYSWEKNKSITQLQEGQELELMVKQLDKEKQEIILSKRDLEPNPWEEFDKNVGDKVEAVIIGINDYGLIVKVGKLEGFIHKSQTHHIYPQQFKKLFKEGQKVEAVITELDREKRNLKLSITQAKPRPFDEFLQDNPEGSEIEAKV